VTGSGIRIAPSVLSADFGHLADQIALAEEGGADLLHVDVMDGHFVPNITVGPMIVEAVNRITRLPLDVHLMIDSPESYVDDFIEAGADMISIHAEACRHLHRTLVAVREKGVAAGVALNPSTPVMNLVNVLEEIDFALVMSVNPGFGGQTFIPQSVEKIREVRAMIAERDANVEIEVDGGVTTANVRDIVGAGADIVVAGSFVFKADDVPGAVRGLREVVTA